MKFERREMYSFKCCCDGRKIINVSYGKEGKVCHNQDGFPTGSADHHHFLILSEDRYNNSEKTNYLLAFPITSPKQWKQEHGIPISQDMLEGSSNLIGSLILFKKPVTIPVSELMPNSCSGKIAMKGQYQELISKMVRYLEATTILNEDYRAKSLHRY